MCCSRSRVKVARLVVKLDVKEERVAQGKQLVWDFLEQPLIIRSCFQTKWQIKGQVESMQTNHHFELAINAFE